MQAAQGVAMKHLANRRNRLYHPAMEYPPTLPDTMLKCVWNDGFSLGETTVLIRRKQYTHISASKGGERWAVIAPTRYEAVAELMEQLGWDLADG